MTHNKPNGEGFAALPISPKIQSILANNNFIKPTPIQHQAIPAALSGKDIVGIAQTGTGKTLAFGIPLLQQIAERGGKALVILPTRELAIQVDETFQKIGRPLNIRTAVLIGGASSHQQIQALKRNAQVIIATPGRLADHLMQRTVSLNDVKIVVLDEADRMFDIGFAPQIKQILEKVPTHRQTMLFSATMPTEIAKLASQYMKLPIRIEVAPAGTAAAKVENEVFIVSKELKMQLLDKLVSDNPGTILIFSRTKRGAKKISAAIRHMGHDAVEMHSDRSLGQRRAALEGFKSGKYRILVATDIAARGIDVSDISLVINYDLPANADDYVHRIGRTGRAGKSGKAISFAAPEERGDIRQIERLIKKTLSVIALPVLPPRRELPPRPSHFQNQPKNGNYPPKRPKHRFSRHYR